MQSSTEESDDETTTNKRESGGRLTGKGTRPPTPQSPALSLTRVGAYEFTGKVLGRGNFARVEEGVHIHLQVKVAVKVVDTSRIREAYVARHLEREARMLSRLRHPSIVALFETLRAGTCYYLVAELASGGDLCALVRRQRGGRMEERSARRLARQLASALAHMHSRGVVHRDLKMENIMMDSAGRRVKIVDFGLSNLWMPGTALRTHCGSPEYAAPELFVAGRAYGPEVDLWSLGVVLFGMLAGRLPFLGPRASEGVSSPERRARLIEQISRGLASPQRRLLAHTSPDFVHLERRLLTQDAAARAGISELLSHPWITARGALPPPRTDPLPLPAASERAVASRRAAAALGVSRSRLLADAAASRYGPAGGAMNIVMHLMCEARIGSGGHSNLSVPSSLSPPAKSTSPASSSTTTPQSVDTAVTTATTATSPPLSHPSRDQSQRSSSLRPPSRPHSCPAPHTKGGTLSSNRPSTARPSHLPTPAAVAAALANIGKPRAAAFAAAARVPPSGGAVAPAGPTASASPAGPAGPAAVPHPARMRVSRTRPSEASRRESSTASATTKGPSLSRGTSRTGSHTTSRTTSRNVSRTGSRGPPQNLPSSSARSASQPLQPPTSPPMRSSTPSTSPSRARGASPRPGSTFGARPGCPSLAARCADALRMFHERARRGREGHLLMPLVAPAPLTRLPSPQPQPSPYAAAHATLSPMPTSTAAPRVAAARRPLTASGGRPPPRLTPRASQATRVFTYSTPDRPAAAVPSVARTAPPTPVVGRSRQPSPRSQPRHSTRRDVSATLPTDRATTVDDVGVASNSNNRELLKNIGMQWKKLKAR